MERLGTRAVERLVQPGLIHYCEECDEPIRFHPRKRPKIILCNVYRGDTWDRLETYHPLCYIDARCPHGPIDRTAPMPRYIKKASA